jgi:hypothetical protein
MSESTNQRRLDVADNRTKIDELIEESYLATLSEEAIRQDLLQFIDACERLMKESHGDQHAITHQITQFKSMALHVEQAADLADDQEAWAAWSDHDLLAHRAARLKLAVLDTMREVDPALADQIERERFPIRTVNNPTPNLEQIPKHMVPPKHRDESQRSSEITVILIKVLYALLAGTTLFVLGWRLVH